MSRVSEYEATIAVEAAARKVWETNSEGYNATMERAGLPPALAWDDPNMNPLTKNEYRNAVLPIVWATLEALPDHRRDIWLAGYDAGSTSSGPLRHQCPFPEEA